MKSREFLPVEDRIQASDSPKMIVPTSVLKQHLNALSIAEKEVESLNEKLSSVTSDYESFKDGGISEIMDKRLSEVLVAVKRRYRMGVTWDEIREAIEGAFKG